MQVAMPLMLDEIREQPTVIQEIIRNPPDDLSELAEAIVARDIRFAYVAARGTSDNAAHYLKYVFEIRHGIPVALAAPSVFTIYDTVPRLDASALVIAISQSGAGPDVNAVIDKARRAGALTACITNTAYSPLAKLCEYSLITPAGAERSVAATKTYTSALAVIATLSIAMSGDTATGMCELSEATLRVEESLTLYEVMPDLVQKYAAVENCVVIGRGYNHCTALEMALKLNETCYIGAKSYSAADFLHGPIAQVSPGNLLLLFAPDGKGYDSIRELVEILSSRHPNLIGFANSNNLLEAMNATIRVPGPVAEWLSPLVYIIPGQLFAYALAQAKGLDPDHPRGLTKVTRTR